VDLTAYNVTTGTLRARGYSGGSACIVINNFEPSAAELFFLPGGGNGSQGFDPRGGMRLARYPNVAVDVPSTADWMQVGTVKGSSTSLPKANVRLAAWGSELAAGGEAWAHGLWRWNWADSHRQILAVTPANGSVTVGVDDINRDVPLTAHANVYAYNLLAELDAAGEYYM